MAGT
ncbi:Protein of unknown function [Bacillus cytotoxicus]|jgi:hypothetical protein